MTDGHMMQPWADTEDPREQLAAANERIEAARAVLLGGEPEADPPMTLLELAHVRMNALRQFRRDYDEKARYADEMYTRARAAELRAAEADRERDTWRDRAIGAVFLVAERLPETPAGALQEAAREAAALRARVEALQGALRDVAIRRGCSEWDESFQKCAICGAANDADAPLSHAHDCPVEVFGPIAEEQSGGSGAEKFFPPEAGEPAAHRVAPDVLDAAAQAGERLWDALRRSLDNMKTLPPQAGEEGRNG